MSIVRTYDVFCDGLYGERFCPLWAEGAGSTEGPTAARRAAKRQGWVRRQGRDLCPRCAKENR